MSSNPVIGSPSASRREAAAEAEAEEEMMMMMMIEKSHGRKTAGVTHTNTITNTYKDVGTPAVSRSYRR